MKRRTAIRADETVRGGEKMVIEKATQVRSEPIKTNNTSYGSWKVLADTSFYCEENGRSWNYPSKVYYFWNKKRALEFIKNTTKQEGATC